jgi:hypothetical protein
MTTATATPVRPPPAIAVVSVLLFAVAAGAVVVLLGNKTVDGDLTFVEVLPAVGLALASAALVGATWSGIKPFWYLEQPMAVAGGIWCAFAAMRGSTVWWALVAGAALWLVVLWLPSSRAWFNSPDH